MLPPCGTTGTPASAHARSTAATSAVFPGRTTARHSPRHRPVQSTSAAARRSGSVSTCAPPTTAASADSTTPRSSRARPAAGEAPYPARTMAGVTRRVGVVTFPGSLDDRDAARAVSWPAREAVPLWHADPDLHGVDAVVLPGGFSYGDYLRCGAIARFAPVMETVIAQARDGLPVLGICNGFQVLCESHLLPGALVRNDVRRFVCRDQRLRIEQRDRLDRRATPPASRSSIPVKNGEGGYVADERTLDELEAEGRVVARYLGDNPNGSARDIAGISNAAGTVVGLMPHPEHAVDPLTGPSADGLGFFTSLLHRRADDRVAARAGSGRADRPAAPRGGAEAGECCFCRGHRRPVGPRRPRRAAAVRRPRPRDRRVRADPRHPRPATDRRRAGRLLGHVERALLVQVEQGPLATVRGEAAGDRPAAGRHRGECRRGRRRRRLGGHLQGRVAQPPVLCGALPGRGDRRRRHRPGHPRHGRAAGRGAWTRCASARRTRRTPPGCCPAWSPASAATATASACPTSAARSSSTRATPATRWSTRSASGVHADGRRSSGRTPPGPGNKVILFGAKTGRDGIGGVSVLASATFDDAQARASGRSVQVGDPFAEKVLIECCLEVYAAGLVVGIQDLGGAGLSCALTELASAGDGGMHVDLDRVPLREASMSPEEVLASESQERMCAVVAPEKVGRLPRRLREVGGAGDRPRRGDRHRPADRRLARRAGRRRPAPDGRARGPGLHATAGATVRPGRPAGRHARPAAAARTTCARCCCGWSPAPGCAAGPG